MHACFPCKFYPDKVVLIINEAQFMLSEVLHRSLADIPWNLCAVQEASVRNESAVSF